MTNQTHIISVAAEDDGAPITGLVNAFITAGIANGFINFDIKTVVTQTRFTSDGVATKQIFYVVQINYYDPSIMG